MSQQKSVFNLSPFHSIYSNRRRNNFFQYLKALAMGISLSLAACGGGSSGVTPVANDSDSPTNSFSDSDTQTSGNDQPDLDGSFGDGVNTGNLSRTTVPPMGSFVLTDTSLKAGKVSTVRYINNSGLDQTLAFIADEDGQVELVAPLAISQDNLTGGQQVDVLLDDRMIGTLSIEALPDHSLLPGTPLVYFLEFILDTHNESYFGLEDKIDSGEYTSSNETDDIFNLLDQRSLFIEDYLDAVENYLDSGTPETVQLTDGVNLTIDNEHILNMDRYVISILYTVLESESNNAKYASTRNSGTRVYSRATRSAFSDLFNGITDNLQLENALIDVRRALRRGEKGAKVLLVATGVGLAAIGITSSGTTLSFVSGVGGIALAGGVIIHEFGNANAIAELINNPSEALSRRGREARQTLEDIALSLCGLANVPCSLLGVAKGAKDLKNAILEFICSTDPELCVDQIAPSCPVKKSLKRSHVISASTPGLRTVCLLPASLSDIPASESPASPTQPSDTSQVLPTEALCPSRLGSAEGSSFIFQDISRSSTNSHHCHYEWRTSDSSRIILASAIIFYTTEMHTTSRPRDEVFCTGEAGAAESILEADLTTNIFARTKVGSNSRQVQVEGQGQYFSVQELTSILREAVSLGIGNGC